MTWWAVVLMVMGYLGLGFAIAGVIIRHGSSRLDDPVYAGVFVLLWPGFLLAMGLAMTLMLMGWLVHKAGGF